VPIGVLIPAPSLTGSRQQAMLLISKPLHPRGFAVAGDKVFRLSIAHESHAPMIINTIEGPWPVEILYQNRVLRSRSG
jgi:alanine-alpha-ketoisovalerate/valine-pyruvate aminotransferase